MRPIALQHRLSTWKRRIAATLMAITMLSFFPANVAFAATGINRTIHYQGKIALNAGTAVSNGSYNVRFKIFDAASSGTQLWAETWDDNTTRVTMTGGLFSVALGTHITMTGSVNFNSDNLYLEIQFDPGNDGVYEEVFAPRRRFAAVPYAHNADQLDGLDAYNFVRRDIDQTASGSLTITKEGIGLDVKGAASGAILHASSQLRSSGSLIVQGTTRLKSYTSCSLITTDSSGNLGCSTGSVGDLSMTIGDGRYVRTSGDTMTGGLLIVNGGAGTQTIDAGLLLEIGGTASGRILHAQDQLRSSGSLVVEGNANFDAETLFVNASSNRVGIGANDPGEKLDVRGNAILITSDPVLTLKDSNSAANETAYIQFWDSGNITQARIGLLGGSEHFTIESQDAAGDMIFETANLERMRILSSGSVGIGTSAPETALEVIGTMSGRTLHGQDSIRSSGSLIVDGASIVFGNSAFTTCTALQTVANVLTCGAGGSGGAFTSTGSLQAYFNNRYVKRQGDTMTGGLLIMNGGAGTATIDAGLLLEIAGTASGRTLHAQNKLTSSGMLVIRNARSSYGTGALVYSSGGVVMALDSYYKGTNAGVKPHLLFGYQGNFDTNLYRFNANILKTDDSLWVLKTLSGGDIFAGTSLRSSGSLVVDGSSIVFGHSTFANCTGLQTVANVLTCGSGGGNFTSTGSLQTAFDRRYVQIQGDTMTGGLLIVNGGAGTQTIDVGLLLEIAGTASGRVLHARDKLTSSGMLVIRNSRSRFGTGALVYSSGGVVMALDSYYKGTNASGKPHLLFGYQGTFDTNLYRFDAKMLRTDSMFVISDSGSGTALKQARFSVDNLQLGSLEGGLYFAGVGLRENVWSLSNHGVTWTARDSSRAWNKVAMSSDGMRQTATVYGGQIYTSTDYGATWTARDSSRNWRGVSMSSDGKIQSAVVYSGQIYTSTDYGATWTARDSSRDWYDVAMSSDGKRQTAVVSGGQIYTSNNYGATWTARESTRAWRNLDMSSDGKIQSAVVYSGQIYTSTDYGATWTARDSGRSWTDIAVSSDGKVQTATVGGGGSFNIYTSTDYGATWTARDTDRDWIDVAMSADGRVQTAVVSGGQIYTSTDYGATWTARDSSRSWYGIAMSSDGKVQTATVSASGQIYVSHADSYLPGGKFGIGTASPDTALEVVGTLSGRTLRAQDALASSGTIVLESYNNGAVSMRSGTGNPNGSVTATLGSLFFATDTGKIWKNHNGGTVWVEMITGSGSIHMAKMVRSSAQSIDNQTTTKIAFDAEEFDVGNIGDFTTNDRFDIVKSGKYMVTASWSTTGNSGETHTYIYKNGSAVAQSSIDVVGVAGRQIIPATTILDLTAGDYIEMYVYHRIGSTDSTLTATATRPQMSVVQVDGVGGSGGGGSLFTDGGAVTYLTSTTDSLAIGATTIDAGVKLEVVGTMSGRHLYISGSGASPLFMTKPGTRSVGIGTSTPVASDSSAYTLQMGSNLVLQNVVGNQVSLTNNAYYDGPSWKYINTGTAQGIRMQSGDISFHTIASGTAGTDLATWDTTSIRMIMKNDGKIGIGTSTPDALVDIEAAQDTERIRLTDSTNSDSVGIYTGSGTPIGIVSAQLGSMYMDNHKGKLYLKAVGDNTSTGWQEVQTGSGTMHMASMSRRAVQSIPNASATKIAFDAEDFDVGDIGDAVTNDRFTIKKSGKYLVSAFYRIDSLSSGQAAVVFIYKNGGDVHADQLTAGAAGAYTANANEVMNLVAGDYIEMYVYQASGGAQNTNSNANLWPRMSVTQLNVTPGADIAEFYGTYDDSINPGDLVVMDPAQHSMVKKSTAPYEKGLMGIVSTRPGMVLGGDYEAPDGAKTIILGLAGRVPVKVTTENGPIEAGDLLTSASKPGFAMRATGPGPVVGQALEAFDGSEADEGLVMTFINNSRISSVGDAVMNVGSGATLQSTDVAQSGSGMTIIVEQSLEKLIESGALLQPIQSEVEKQIEFLSIDDRIEARINALLDQKLGTGSVHSGQRTVDNGQFVPSSATGSLTASTLSLEETLSVGGDTRIGGDLYLEGTLNVSNLFVPGMMMVDGSLAVGGALAANTLDIASGATIRGSTTVYGSIDLASGAMLRFASGSTIDVSNLIVKSALKVLGPITIEGLATFLGDVDIQGELILSSRQAGQVRIPRSGTAAVVYFDPPLRNKPIITASPDVPVLYAVSFATATGFTIRLAGPATEAVTFSWIAVGSTGTGQLLIDDADSSLIPFPVDATGTPISSNNVWNACIRNQVILDADGKPLSCSRYHQANVWEHPDLLISFTWNTAVTPALLVLPEGYEVTVVSGGEAEEVQEAEEVIEAPVEAEPVEEIPVEEAPAVEVPVDPAPVVPEEVVPVEQPVETPVAPVKPAPAPAEDTTPVPDTDAPAPVEEPAPVAAPVVAPVEPAPNESVTE